MPTLIEIDKLTKAFSEARQILADRVRGLEDEIQAIKRKRLPTIKTSVNAVMIRQAELKAALDESKALFMKPKTIILHGIKVGYQKAKGKISWADDAQVVRLIKKHLPDQADVLIKVTEKPIKDALINLPAADLKKIGVTVADTGDQTVIKSTDGEIDKFVDALLKDETQNHTEEAA